MLAILILATAFMAYQGTRVEVSYQFSRLLPLTDSTQIDYDQFRETFRQAGNTIVITAEDLDVFDRESYRHWRDLENSLDTVKGINNILSPISAYYLQRNDSVGKLEVNSMREDFNAESSDSLRELYTSLPFYENLLYSRDGQSPLMFAQIDYDLLYNKNVMRIVESVKKIVADYQQETGQVVHASGLPFVRMANTKKVSREVFKMVGLALLVTTLLMYMFMRSFKATLITMVVVVMGVCWSFGLIGLFDFRISMLSALIPSLIIVIGVPNCIFLINKYHSEYKFHKNKIRAVQRVIRKIGAATLLTNATTAMGFAALILTDSVVLKEFGTVASINILMVFVISIIVIPIYYSFSKNPKKRHYVHLDTRWLNGFIGFLINTVHHHRNMVYFAALALTVAGIYGATLIKTTGNITEEYKESDPLLKDLRFFEKSFGGVVPLEIIVDTKRANGAERLSFIRKMEELQRKLDSIPGLSRSISLADGLKYAKQAYYRGNPEFYSLPNRQESNFILSSLPSGGTNLGVMNTLTDSTGSKGRISMQAADFPTEKNRVLQAAINDKINEVFDRERYDITITGASVVFLKGTGYLIKNLFISLLLAVLLISIIMALLFRSFAMVIVSLAPNLFPLLMTAGIMGYFGVPLKPSTILVFSIAFGISVDDTIHFLAKYRQELRSNGWDIVDAVMVSIRETGVSMFYTSVVLFFGFSVFMSSSFGGIISLGILVSVTLIIAMLSNLILLPTLLMSLATRISNREFNKPIISIYAPEDEEGDDNDGDEDEDESLTKEKLEV
jgi:predicted RND superfamily exporter protein